MQANIVFENWVRDTITGVNIEPLDGCIPQLIAKAFSHHAGCTALAIKK